MTSYAARYAAVASSWNEFDKYLGSAIKRIPRTAMANETNRAELDEEVAKICDARKWQDHYSATFWQTYGSLRSP